MIFDSNNTFYVTCPAKKLFLADSRIRQLIDLFGAVDRSYFEQIW